MTPNWVIQSIFYHIYPLGLCGAPKRNDFTSPPQPRLESLYPWLDHIQELGANAIYLGPLFESTSHGYNTADYYQVDRRLGTRQTLKDLSNEIHRRGMRLVLDGVFNHVGRDFWAFKDLQAYRERSIYAGWFHNLNFQRPNSYGDPFSYEGWAGHNSLVKLNLSHPHVRDHLFDAVRMWVDEFGIDGLRLDAADAISPDFLAALAQVCRSLRSDFWLMGEMVHGDYRKLANPAMLDATTNYECYKGLYSSFNDHNFFEIAYAINRQSGPGGIYRDLSLYNFADNHDVDRVASSLKNPAHLAPLYTLLLTMPGVPSVYYGSEWGIKGSRTQHSDEVLRPALHLYEKSSLPYPELAQHIAQVAQIRRQTPALQSGEYQQLHVSGEQFAFLRSHPSGSAIVILNAASEPKSVDFRLPMPSGSLVDLMNPNLRISFSNHQARIEVSAYGAAIKSIENEQG